MNFFKIMLHKLLFLIQLFLVIVFIIFEEIIWEGIAQPIYKYIHSLEIVKKFEIQLQKVNSYIALLIFTTLLLIVEGAGLLAGVLFIKGQMITGAVLYILKIPLAVFTFWIFNVTKFKLLNFRWFALSYKKTISLINKVQNLDIYIKSMNKLSEFKILIKGFFIDIKVQFFDSYKNSNTFSMQIKNLYRFLKDKFQNTKE